MSETDKQVEAGEPRSILTQRPISHDKAKEAFRRFENKFWRKNLPGPRISIPAKPDYDDDLILAAYFAQQERSSLAAARKVGGEVEHKAKLYDEIVEQLEANGYQHYGNAVAILGLIHDLERARQHSPSVGEEEIAKVINRARYPDDREPRELADEDQQAQAYARRLARAVLALLSTSGREGWSVERIKSTLDSRLNDCLCEMREGWDDSIVGFNEAWDIMRKVFADAAPTAEDKK